MTYYSCLTPYLLMGRKSSTKKAIRELVEEEKEQRKGFFSRLRKKSTKQLKQELKKKTEGKKVKASGNKTKKKKTSSKNKKSTKTTKEKTKKLLNKKTALGFGFFLIMFALLVTLGFLLVQKAFRPTSVAVYLPEKETLFYLEINTDQTNHQVKKAKTLLASHPDYNYENGYSLIDDLKIFDYKADIEPWLGRQIAVAFINSSKNDSQIYKINFAEITYKNKVDPFLLKLKNNSIYYDFLDNYLVFSTEKNAITELIEQNKSSKKLFSSQSFNRINNNLPINRNALLFINFPSFKENFFKYYPQLNKNNFALDVFLPIKNLLNKEGLVVMADDEKFIIQSFLSLNQQLLKDNKYIAFNTKYRGDLISLLPPETIAFYGGQDLEYQLERLVSVLTNNNSKALEALYNLFEKYTQQYFGTSISLHRDLLPLFKNEYLISLEENDTHKILLYLENPLHLDSIDEIARNFVTTFASSSPKVVEHTLKDGTVVQEIRAVPEEITFTSTTYKDTEIHEAHTLGKETGMYYALMDKILIIADKSQGVQSTIDIIRDNKPGFDSNPAYQKLVTPLLAQSDEITYINIAELLPELKPVSTITSGKNYFQDGITSINYLEIE